MKKKTALIFGITGQDGAYLADFLIKKNYIVHGIKRRSSSFNTGRIFKRFYSNRPEKFGEHSGLGLNIVKSIVQMHGGNVRASNRSDNQKGAQIEVELPKKYNQ